MYCTCYLTGFYEDWCLGRLSTELVIEGLDWRGDIGCYNYIFILLLISGLQFKFEFLIRVFSIWKLIIKIFYFFSFKNFKFNEKRNIFLFSVSL